MAAFFRPELLPGRGAVRDSNLLVKWQLVHAERAKNEINANMIRVLVAANVYSDYLGGMQSCKLFKNVLKSGVLIYIQW